LKRKALIKDPVKGGCYLKRHGNRQDVYANPRNGRRASVPGNPEIKASLVRLIKKQLGVLLTGLTSEELECIEP